MISYQELFRSHSKFINHIPFIKLGEIDNLSELTNEALNFYKNRKPTALLSIHPTDLEYTGVDVLGIYDYAGQDISHIGESYLEEHHNSIVPELNYQKGDDIHIALYRVFKLHCGSIGLFKPLTAMEIYSRFKP